MMEELRCLTCGSPLKQEGDNYSCAFCGSIFTPRHAEESAAALKSILSEEKAERLANCKRVLWQAVHEKYPSKEKVCDAAKSVLNLKDDDFLANVYLHSHDIEPFRLNVLLASSNVSKPEASEAVRWLLPSLTGRMVGPLHDFVDRHFADKERLGLINEIEAEADKLESGIYEPALPREVFLCYSSHDMAKVVEVMDVLEQNDISCFAAFRNLRHGKGAQENYLNAIKTAMRSCQVFVFLSSRASRLMSCDAMKVELPYLVTELPGKTRIEFLLEDYEDTPYLVRKTLKKAFPEQEYCTDTEDLMDRIMAAVEALERGGVKEAVSPAPAPKEMKDAEDQKPKAKPKLDEESAKAKKNPSPVNEPAPAEEKLSDEQVLERFMGQFEKDLAREAAKPKKESAKEKKAPTPSLRVTEKYVYYGEYPQSSADPDLSATLAKQKKNKDSYVVYQGNRYAEIDGQYFLVEPIKWRILYRSGDDIRVISESILDAHVYDQKSKVFASSEIMKWLNDEFLSLAFPDGGKHLVKEEGALISLPSVDSLKYYLASKKSREAKATPYAAAHGVKHNYYWTKTPRRLFSYRVFCISSSGDVEWTVVELTDGVRPYILIRVPKK